MGIFTPPTSVPKNGTECFAPIDNFYGKPAVFQLDGKYYFSLDNYDEMSSVEVSREFYNAFVKEFKEKENG